MSSAVSETSETTRRFTLRHASLILLVIGVIITGYLSYEHLAGGSVVCVGGNAAFDCDAVNSSIYSKFMGIYVGYLGLAADLIMIAILLLEPRIAVLRSYGATIVFGIVLLGWLYHDYLTYVSFAILQHLCIWCLSEHTIMTLLLIVSSIRVYRDLFSAPTED